MRIACPQCQTVYRVDDALIDAIFVCHRCGEHFSLQNEDAEETPSAAEKPLPLFDGPSSERKQPSARTQASAQAHPQPSVKTDAFDDHQPETQAPRAPEKRETADRQTSLDEPWPSARKHRLWPWLAGVLLLLIGGGFWLQQDAWLNNRWLRGMALNIGLPIEQRDEDWRIIPESVQAQWIIRDDKSKVLVIEGRVANLLASALPPPRIEVVFYAADQPDRILLKRTQEITRPPTMDAIRHAPFIPPDRDIIPVPAHGERGFILVLEALPENAGEFALTARAAS